MQPVWLCILSARRFEETFEIIQWRKVKQMQPMQLGNLRKHLKIHSGEKSNKSKQCNYASSQASHLRRNLKNGTSEKKNKSNQSHYASSRPGDLRRHLKIHSGEKSNKCNQCDFASIQAGDLSRHLKIHSALQWKKSTSATNMTMHLLGQTIWRRI